jgi:hypothetical protein
MRWSGGESRRRRLEAEGLPFHEPPPLPPVRAAECVMNHSSKAIEIEDVAARVEELERVAAMQKPGERK